MTGATQRRRIRNKKESRRRGQPTVRRREAGHATQRYHKHEPGQEEAGPRRLSAHVQRPVQIDSRAPETWSVRTAGKKARPNRARLVRKAAYRSATGQKQRCKSHASGAQPQWLKNTSKLGQQNGIGQKNANQKTLNRRRGKRQTCKIH